MSLPDFETGYNRIRLRVQYRAKAAMKRHLELGLRCWSGSKQVTSDAEQSGRHHCCSHARHLETRALVTIVEIEVFGTALAARGVELGR